MMNLSRYSFFIFLMAIGPVLSGQNRQFGFAGNLNKIEIPFEMKNDLMLVDVTFNHILPLKFIFDTGAQSTILSKREITDVMNVPYLREFTIMGADMTSELKAYLVQDIHFVMGGKAAIPNHSLLVLEEDYFRFDELTGLKIHGILGADIFRGMVVKINYERRKITLIRKNKFSPPKGYYQVPIEVNQNKAYLHTRVSIMRGEPRQVKLLLDSGAMVSLLINTNEDKGLTLPPDIIRGKVGAGLGGFIEGYMGRAAKVEIGKIECREILTNFQELGEDVDTAKINGRNGIIGNKLLKRFHLIIDYSSEILYFKPNKKFKEKDEFDKSGLVIIAVDVRLNKFIVHDIFVGSSGDSAGIKKEDYIVRINGFPTSLMSLTDINNKLSKKEGKKIRMVVSRNGEKMKFIFRLKKLI